MDLKRDVDREYQKIKHQDVVEAARKHINSFPRYMSHYCRKDSPDMEYLPQNPNIAMMYRMYIQEEDSKAMSESIYRNIFNTHFNLKFQQPKKDTCTKCDTYKTQISAMQNETNIQEQLEELENKRNDHQQSAEKAREQLKADRIVAKQGDSNAHVVTFDLQSTLPTPRRSSNIVYYKCQLMVYNMGIHDCKTEAGYTLYMCVCMA